MRNIRILGKDLVCLSRCEHFPLTLFGPHEYKCICSFQFVADRRGSSSCFPINRAIVAETPCRVFETQAALGLSVILGIDEHPEILAFLPDLLLASTISPVLIWLLFLAGRCLRVRLENSLWVRAFSTITLRA